MSGISSYTVNYKGTPGFYADTLVNRPAFGLPGRIFFDTSTPGIQRDTGSSWQDIFPPATGYVPASRILTIAGLAQDLSVDRTWNVSFASLTGKPTTLAGYGITDAVPASRQLTIAGTTQDLSIDRTFNVSFASLTGKPTTLAGYGITDGIAQGGNSFSATMVIGTNDNNTVRMNVNTVQRFLMTTGGITTLTTALNANGGINVKNNNASVDNNWAMGVGTAASGNDGEWGIWRSTSRIFDLNSVLARFNNVEVNSTNGVFTGGSLAAAGTALSIGSSLVGQNSAASGISNLVSIGLLTNNRFAPTSGSGSWNTLLVQPVINQTGGANGNIQGVNVGLTITAMNGTFTAYYTDVNTGFCFQSTGANAKFQIASSIKTGDPGAGAADWKLGTVQAGVVALDTANYVQVTINGTIVKLLKAA